MLQHIHDYDNGKLLAASISRGEKLAKSHKTPSSYTATFGMHDYFGKTQATIGDGDVTIAEESGESLNRDPNSVQSFEKDIDIKPIKLFYTTDLAERHNEFMEAGGFAGALQNIITEAKNSISMLGEIIQQLSQPLSQPSHNTESACKDGVCQSSKTEKSEQQVKLSSLVDGSEVEGDIAEEKIELSKFDKKKQELLEKVLAQIERSEKTFARDEKDGNKDFIYILKQVDKYYLYGKASVGFVLIEWEEAVAGEYPEFYNKLSLLGNEALKLVGSGINKVDDTLYRVGGDKYKSLKEGFSELVRELDKNAPEIVSDGAKIFTIGGAAGGIFKITKHVVKELPNIGNKLDDVGGSSKSHNKLNIEKISEVLATKDTAKITEILKKEANWDINKGILDKIPPRFFDSEIELAKSILKPKNPYGGIKLSFKENDHIRIMQGNKAAQHASQQQDYIKIVSNGKVIGRDGMEVKASESFNKPKDNPYSHIPIEEYKKWQDWNKK